MPNWLRMSIFITIVSLILIGMHWIIYRQIRVAFAIPDANRWLKYSVGLLSVLYILSSMLGRSTPNWLTESLFAVASVWLGLAAYLFVFGLASELIQVLSRIIQLSRLTGWEQATLQRWIASSAVGLTVIFSFWAYLVAQGDFVLRQVEFRSSKIPQELDGYKVIVFSDLHAGAIHRTKYVSRVVETVNQQKADLILIPGDIADGDQYLLEERLALLAKLQSRDGAFWSSGNHDYYTGIGYVQRIMDKTGVKFLSNQAITVAGGKLIVAGVNDPTDRDFGGSGMSFEHALAGVDQKKPTLLLCHQPRKFRDAFRLGADVIVSGHTHGGQTWPFNYIVNMIWEVPRGAYREMEKMLYVSVGIGTWGPPMRLSQPPEYIAITLRAG